jgi:hypothetical protein
MSENLDLVRSIYATWERGDFSPVEGAHPEIEYSFADGPDPGSWRGLAAMGRARRERASVWQGFRWGAGARAVLALGVGLLAYSLTRSISRNALVRG